MDDKTPKLFIFAGENSGDLHGSHLIQAIKKTIPLISFDGVAGPRMRSHGIQGPHQMEDFEVMGITDVLKNLPKLCSQFYNIRNHILTTNPRGIVLIDYPGFNLRLAQALRKKGFKGKIIQYVSPSVWAHGAHRINQMAKTLDLLLTIFPFEKHSFDVTKLNVAYVGNPLCEYIKNYSYDEHWLEKLSLPKDKRIIALFPGSRHHEILRNLPIMLEAAAKYKKIAPDAVFAISCVHPTIFQQLHTPSILQGSLFTIPKEFTYELMRDSRTAIAKSGTVTLELALHKRPTVVVYKLTTLNRLYAQYILKLKLPFYCIVNILAKRCVFPELIEKGFSADILLQHLQTLDAQTPTRQECIEACEEISKSLSGDQDASLLSAKAIQEVLSC